MTAIASLPPIGEAENAASLEPDYIPELPFELISMNKFLEFANSENSRKSFGPN